MDLSKLRSRRNILALALAGVGARVVPVKAMQLNAGCEYGITNGIVTIGGADCDLPVPQQMIDARTNADGDDSILGTASSQGTSTTGTSTTSTPSTSTSTTSPQAERQAKLQEHRSRKRRKKTSKRSNQDTKQGRRKTRKSAERDAQEEADRLAAMAQCTDFIDQKSAIESLAQFEDEWETLDPDRDDLPCENLDALTCDQVWLDEKDRQGVTSWFKRHGYSGSNDPFGFYDDAKKVFCYRDQPQTTTQAQIVDG